jgi:phospholipase/carboxylesterase
MSLFHSTKVSLDALRQDPASGAARSLVVLLHGYGANGADLFALAPSLAPLLPDTAFVAPDAPEPCEMGGGGFQWFGLLGSGGRMQVRVEGADAVAPILAAFLEAELARLGLDSSRLGLVGFSQGTMMALHVGLRLHPAPAAIVGFSGMLVAPGRLASEQVSRPPVLLIHGESDPVVPYRALAEAQAELGAAGVPVETVSRPRLGHGIDESGLRAAASFLVRHLGA